MIPEKLATQMQEAVDKGAAFLDKHDPGWWSTINVGTLDLSNCAACVIGQLCAEKGITVHQNAKGLGWGIDTFPVELGFDAPHGDIYEANSDGHDVDLQEDVWPALEQMWVDKIKERWAQ